jgi:hypothetical protein
VADAAKQELRKQLSDLMKESEWQKQQAQVRMMMLVVLMPVPPAHAAPESFKTELLRVYMCCAAYRPGSSGSWRP